MRLLETVEQMPAAAYTPLTVREVAFKLGESPNVIRNWIRELKPYINLDRDPNSNQILFSEDNYKTILKFRQLVRVEMLTIKDALAKLAPASDAAAAAASEESLAIIQELKVMNEILTTQNKDQQKMIQLLEESLIIQRLEAEKNLAREQVAADAEPKRRTFVQWLFNM